MKIAIHDTKGSFSNRWIEYCQNHGIECKLVDCFKSDIIQQLNECDALMWHFNHKGTKEVLFAKQLLFSVQSSGKKVFPDFNTVWHFDDKVAQKYLFESIGAPLAGSYVFYEKKEALRWAKNAGYPKVFKLRNGAGSTNVRLIKSKREAFKTIRKAFGFGLKQYDAWNNLKERFRKYSLGKLDLWNLLKGVIRLFYTTNYARIAGREKGYVYFQDYIAGNDHDVRVIVIGDKAFAIKRMVRKNDFRASGSGDIHYEKEAFKEETIQLSFQLADKLKSQCAAFDFVYFQDKAYVIEVSYGFGVEAYDYCPGYWDKNLNWNEGPFNPYGWMVEDLIKN